MAGRRNFYFRQQMADGELDGAFNELEKADRAIVADLGLTGIAVNAQVTPHSPTTDLTVDVAAGVLYDPQGRRIVIPSLQRVDVSVDSNGASTTVSGGGNEKWVSVFAKFRRVQTDARIDGNSATVFFVDDESVELRVVQGAEAAAGGATRPSLDPTGDTNGVLLADIRRYAGQTAIEDADLSAQSGTGLFSTSRREDAYVLTADTYSVRAGNARQAMQAVLTIVDQLVANQLAYGGAGNWADGTTNPATTIEGQLDKIVSDLSGTGGGAKVGFTFAAGTWAGGATPTNTGGTVAGALNGIKADLGSSNGASDVGCLTGFGTWADAGSVAATTVQGALAAIVTTLGANTGVNKVGAPAFAAPFVGAPYTATAGPFGTQLTTLFNAVNNPTRMRFITLSATIDSAFRDGTIFVNISASANLALPNPVGQNGRRIYLVDATGCLSPTTSLTLTRYGSEKINNLAANFVLEATYGRWILLCDGTDWHLM